MAPTPTPFIKLTGDIRDRMSPVNEFMFDHLYILAFVVVVLVFLIVLKKIKGIYIYKKYKNKSRNTNKWFDWVSYGQHFKDYLNREEEKKNAIFLQRLERREQNRHPKAKR